MKKLFRHMYSLPLFILLIGTSYDVMSEEVLIEGFEPVVLIELEKIRGLGGIVNVTNTTDLSAILTGNDASNATTGFNIIDQGSFNEASGVFSIIQNTGNNVIIQDSTTITVTITPE